MTAQGETARQIAERIKVFVREARPGGCKMFSQGDGCACPLCDADRLADSVASLTAALAQAQQELEAYRKACGYRDPEESEVKDRIKTHEINVITAENHRLYKQLAAAEQARDEARKDAQGYSEQTAQVWQDNDRLKREAESAARTALLEAAEDAGKWIELPDAQKLYLYAHGDRKQVIEWLTARAGGQP